MSLNKVRCMICTHVPTNGHVLPQAHKQVYSIYISQHSSAYMHACRWHKHPYEHTMTYLCVHTILHTKSCLQNVMYTEKISIHIHAKSCIDVACRVLGTKVVICHHEIRWTYTSMCVCIRTHHKYVCIMYICIHKIYIYISTHHVCILTHLCMCTYICTNMKSDRFPRRRVKMDVCKGRDG